MSETNSDKRTERNYGIDLLKIFSIFMVLVLHILGQGGILKTVVSGTCNYYIVWLMEISAFCAVNCFAICTGYLLVGKKVRYRKLAMLWIIVFFYTALTMAIGKLSGISYINPRVLFPVVSNAYWYFTAYFGMFFLIPYMNILADNLSKSNMQKMLLSVFVLFCILPLISYKESDPFVLNKGYSVLWLICMYFIGAGIKKFGLFAEKLSKVRCIIGFVVAVLVTLAVKLIAEKAVLLYPSALTTYFFTLSSQLVQYTSPMIVLSSVFLFVFFSKLNVPEKAQKPIKWLSPMVFQVYIIHLHYVIWNEVLCDRFAFFAQKPAILMVAMVISSAIVIFAACLVIDIVRKKLFAILPIERIVDKVSDYLLAKMKD